MSISPQPSDRHEDVAAQRYRKKPVVIEAMQWRDWQTCEILIDERATSDWYVPEEEVTSRDLLILTREKS